MRIIKRKKGKRFYLYLQHSYRKEGRVVTRERYLGCRVPKNVDSLKAAMIREARHAAYVKLKRIRHNFQKSWREYPPSVREREKEEIAIAFTYNTNAIEGSTITLDEARVIIRDKVSPNKPLKDIRETESHCRVFLEMLNTKGPVTNQLLKLWHLRIFQETKPDVAGRYRRYLVRVGNHIAPDWKKVNALMRRYITFLREPDIVAPELAARAHYRFEKIHPFGDGNGRIGRLVMNCLLWRRGHPMLIIENRKRAAYYRALERDEEGFVGYFLRTYLKVHKNWAR